MSVARRPSLPPMPDLAHLTEEERSIIESVIQRQREEEEKEQEILRSLQDDFETYQASVKKLTDESRTTPVPTQTGAVCEICHKTKFADGIGHKCHYCGVRSCARCGGKMALRPNKQIWSCNLCKKKQELLVKTGQCSSGDGSLGNVASMTGPFFYSCVLLWI
ncbi:hypothetical protein CAPTEDRAFT_202548 [Capitella teleta]|uniref:FYVE-type domain-containing protein n=1 Tax=Capitella teleta TaxID=283909 RepID=R7V5P8_CAPTE|nr:hypothetical protein CAPTEDRAFT_202548 [Capitella teleta]|eukprot:ELU13904.1 hypothetical protein CAPTEDRAFT_202548 [Capitella teleta]